MLRVVAVLLHLRFNLSAGVGEVTQQLDLVRKRNKKHAVLRTKHRIKEHAQVMLMLLAEVALAATVVQDEPKRERHIRAAGKERDLLQDSVFKYLNVVLGKVSDERAFGITGAEGHVDQLDLDSHWRVLGRAQILSASSQRQTREHKENG